MAYFEDLTPYTYSRLGSGRALLNVGWLSRGHHYAHGPTPAAFQERLLQLCRYPLQRMRGFHDCEWCPRQVRQYRLIDGTTIKTGQLLIQRGDAEIGLGNGEVHAQDQNGTWYSAPTLIYHYVTAHQYQPPQVFIEAVMKPKCNNVILWQQAGHADRCPSARAIEEAKGKPCGRVEEVDPDVRPSHPSEASIGQWRVNERGEIVGDFMPNPFYKVSRERMIHGPVPTDWA